MPYGAKSLDQGIEDARRVLNARIARKRKVERQGHLVTASLVLETADGDPDLAKRIREIVSKSVKGKRDRGAVASTLERLAEAERKGQSQAPIAEPQMRSEPNPEQRSASAANEHDHYDGNGRDPHRADRHGGHHGGEHGRDDERGPDD